MRKSILLIYIIFYSVTLFCQTAIPSGFSVKSQVPIDSRYVFSDTNARNALSANYRYQGLITYVTSNQRTYQLIGGITNSFWSDISKLWSNNGTKIYYNSGNVGIGTSNPAYKLEVGSPTSTAIKGGSNAGYGVYGSSGSSTAIIGISTNYYGVDGQSTNGPAGVTGWSKINGVEGESSTSGIGGSFKSLSGIGVKGTSVTGNQFYFGNDVNSTIDSCMVMKANGNVGIGTSSPLSKIDIANGTLRIRQLTTDITPDSVLSIVNGEMKAAYLPKVQDSTKSPLYYNSGNILQRITTSNIGLGSSLNPLHKLVAVTSSTAGKYAYNFVDGDINKNRTTVVKATDTSSNSLYFTNTGKPVWKINSETGSTLFGQDSITMTITGGTQPSSKISYISTSGSGSSSEIAHEFKGGTNGGTSIWTGLNNGNSYFNGKIGVGTTNPTSLIHGSSTKSTSKLLFLSNKAGTGEDSTVLINSSGHLGIGTSNASYLSYGLAVIGGIITNSSYYTTSNAYFNSYSLALTNDGLGWIGNSSTATSSALGFKTKNTEVARFDPSGKFGIGIISPVTKLQVKDGSIRSGVIQSATIDSSAIRLINTGKGVIISGDSGLRLIGTSTVWDDLRVDGLMTNGGAGEPVMTNNFKGVNGMYQRAWQGSSTDDQLFFNVQLPHTWKQNGGGIECHIHTFPWTTPSVSDSVVWEFSYSWANINGTFPDFVTDTTCVHMYGVSQWQHKIVELVNLNTESVGKTLSSVLACRLRRLANSNTHDTYTGAMGIVSIDFHYEINSLGSDTEITKLGN